MRGRGVSVARRSSSSTGVKQQMRSAVRPWAPQLELYLSLRGQLKTVLRSGGAQRVATHPLEAVPLAGRHAERGMEIEAVVARLTRPEPWRVGDGGQGGAAATDPGAGPRPERDPALHRRRREPGQHRGLLGPFVHRAPTRIGLLQPLRGQ